MTDAAPGAGLETSAGAARPGILSGKVLVVTGGASGIGRGIALAGARHGAATVVVADLQEAPKEGGETTMAAVEALGAATRFWRTDVTDRSALAALMEEAARLGGVDVMACNAGIAVPGDGPEISADDFEALVAVNLDGVLASAQAAARQMRQLGKQGSIVITSSMGGLRGGAATVGYSTTKGGVGLMAASLAAAYGPSGIRVNAVCPGIIETALIQSSPDLVASVRPLVERTPLRRLGQPEEVGDAVCWLGSDAARFVTGVSLPVDGGLTAVI